MTSTSAPLQNAEPPFARVTQVGGHARFWRYMMLIIAAKILLEMFFFVGVARQYGEEDAFVSLALPPTQPGQTYWTAITRFTEVPGWAESKGDPGDMYPMRIAALYPNIFFMRAFGPSEYSLALWTAITGIGTVLLVGLIGKSLVDAPTGLFSASILALIPGHILYSARVDTDMPQLLFLCLGIFLLVPALKASTRRRQLFFAAASGLSFGILYLAKLLPAFLALSWALLIPFMLALLDDKETLLAPAGKLRQAALISTVLLGSFALVFLAENCAYHSLTGFWWLNLRTMRSNGVNLDSWRCGKFITFGVFKIWLTPLGWEDWLAHTKMFWGSLFPVGWQGSIYCMPIHGWSAIAFLPAFLVLPFLQISHRKLSLLIILGFVLYYLHVEVFWIFPTIEDGMLNLTFANKVHRYVFPCYIGISLCVGLVLGSIFSRGGQHPRRWLRRIFQLAPVCIVFAFGAANYPGLRYFHKLLRDSLADVRQSCADLKTIAPDGAGIFVGAGSDPYYRLFQYPRHYWWRYFVDAPEDAVCNGWGVVGGSLGMGVSEACIDAYPNWLCPYCQGQVGPPAGWRLIKTRPTAAGVPSLSPVRILELPAFPHQTP
jgi:4-amino-4-deoxy-L-arabinose transferase-like glycosyltransferase